MTRFGWIVATGLLVALLGIALLLWGFSQQSDQPEEGPVGTAPALDPNMLSIYTSGAHGFSFMYPSTATLDDSLGDAAFAWRANTNASGTPVAHVTAGTSEVRVGVSNDSRAVAACEDPGPSEREGVAFVTETAAWSVFTFEELGTENERRATSYRRMAGERCVAVEIFEPRIASAETQPADLRLITRSFTFAN